MIYHEKERRFTTLLAMFFVFTFLLFPSIVLAEKVEKTTNAEKTENVILEESPWLYDETNKVSSEVSNKISQLNRNEKRGYNYTVIVVDDADDGLAIVEEVQDKEAKDIIILISLEDKQFSIDYNGNVEVEKQKEIQEQINKKYHDLDKEPELNDFILNALETIESSNANSSITLLNAFLPLILFVTWLFALGVMFSFFKKEVISKRAFTLIAIFLAWCLVVFALLFVRNVKIGYF